MSAENSGDDGPGSNHRLENLGTISTEARQTLDVQISWLREIDRKAIQILRANILLVGLTITALSIFVRADGVSLTPFINDFSVLGIAMLLGSTFFAGVTFVSSRHQPGVGHEDIRQVHNDDFTTSEVFDKLSRGYTNWINYNDFVIKFNAWLCGITILLAVDAVIFISTGVAVGASGMKGTPASFRMLAVLVVLMLVLNYAVLRLDEIMNWTFQRVRKVED